MADSIEVLLYGLGAIGSFYAFILNRCDRVRLTVVARSNYDAVVKDGISIDSKNHGQHWFRPDHVIRSPSEITGKHFDFIVCTHKAIDPVGALIPLDPVVDKETTFVVLQNGVGNEDPFRERFPHCTIISGVVWVGASQPNPGIIFHTSSENTDLGLFPNPLLTAETETERLQTFTSLFSAGGTTFTTPANIQLHRWEKVIWNVAWNAITTLTCQDVQSWLESSPDAISWTRRLMEEVIAVARACGVPIRDGLAEDLLERAGKLGKLRTSMQTDRECGRAMEIEVILGVPVKRGRERGVEIPLLESLYVLLLAVNRQVLGTT
ncbi:ketopantoate reductase PanE/ApbA-domain-containing protein [Aspergillus cavernicola]|uniref:2-dehydropantoate 2-reductase n=1 Tax=Aspergillus cavernicola TaxID=176166 RepID=A0ABR4HDC2_9EURO